jgi:hypothetical protein
MFSCYLFTRLLESNLGLFNIHNNLMEHTASIFKDEALEAVTSFKTLVIHLQHHTGSQSRRNSNSYPQIVKKFSHSSYNTDVSSKINREIIIVKNKLRFMTHFYLQVKST